MLIYGWHSRLPLSGTPVMSSQTLIIGIVLFSPQMSVTTFSHICDNCKKQIREQWFPLVPNMELDKSKGKWVNFSSFFHKVLLSHSFYSDKKIISRYISHNLFWSSVLSLLTKLQFELIVKLLGKFLLRGRTLDSLISVWQKALGMSESRSVISSQDYRHYQHFLNRVSQVSSRKSPFSFHRRKEVR